MGRLVVDKMSWLKSSDGEYEFVGFPENYDSDDDSDDDTVFDENYTKEDRDELRNWLENL